MNEERVREIIRQEIQQADSKNRFTLTPINSHTHDGINSPTAFQPIITYVGFIGTLGEAYYLPNGWSVTHPGTGEYHITLPSTNDTLVLAMSASAVNQNTPPLASFPLYVVTIVDENTFGFTWYDGLTNTGLDVLFFFSFTIANNRSAQVPTYNISPTLVS